MKKTYSDALRRAGRYGSAVCFFVAGAYLIGTGMVLIKR